MKTSIAAFLPCRKGSQRIKNKNIKTFAGISGGLVRIKLLQLIEIDEIQKIYLSTNDEEIIYIANGLNSEKIHIDRRPEYLCLNETTTDELIKYVPMIIEEDNILWTHVTSPFINEFDYKNAISEYFHLLNSTNHDSLMSVSKIQKFLWNKQGPINYNRLELKWPFTQSINPIYEVNSGIFISSLDNYLKYNDRIGIAPYLLELNSVKSFDIDWEEDFFIAEQIFKQLSLVK